MAKQYCISCIDYTLRDHPKPTRVRGNRTFKTKKVAQAYIDTKLNKTLFKNAYPVEYNPSHKDYHPRIIR